MTTERLPLQQPGVKDRIKRYVPRRLWNALRRGKRSSQEMLSRIFINAAVATSGPSRTLCLLYDTFEFTPELVIQGYMQGIGLFPTNGRIRWYDPDPRGIIPIEGYHVEKETMRILRQGRFEVTVDRDFAGVIRGCAEPKPGRESTFITRAFIDVYLQLHSMGVAHSVEAWQDGYLVGGVFGLALGAYFIGESQFHRVSNAGKIAFVYTLEILRRGGFQIHDAFWLSQHIAQFGGYEIPREEFKRRLARAVVTPATFAPLDEPPNFS